MRFQVPQFIESETKAIGPLTFVQAAWLGIGGFLIFIAFTILPLIAAVLLALVLAPVAVALAFMKVNDVPLITYVVKYISYLINPKQYRYRR